MRKKIANYSFFQNYLEGGLLGLGSQQEYIKDPTTWDCIVKLSHTWRDYFTTDEIVPEVIERFPDLDEEMVGLCVERLSEKHMLINEGMYNSDERYSRNHLYLNSIGLDPIEAQEKLHQSKVAIVGCGGIGNHVSYMLATAGVGTLVLADDDHIEPSNLTRQVLFTEEDYDLKKIDILEREILKRNSATNIEKIPLTVTGPSDFDVFHDVDLLVLSADYPFNIVNWANSFSIKHKAAFINVGYMNDISVVGPFVIPGKTSCFSCTKVMATDDDKSDLTSLIKDIHTGYKPSTFAPVNGVAASYATGDILRYLAGSDKIVSANKRVGIYSDQATLQEQPMPKNEECSVCSKM